LQSNYQSDFNSIKYPFKALTYIKNAADLKDLHNFLIIRKQAELVCHIPGLIKKSELPDLAKVLNLSTSQTRNRLNTLIDRKFIIKLKNGWKFLSQDAVYKLLNITKKEITDKDGNYKRAYHPFLKIEVNDFNLKYFNEIRLFHLLVQLSAWNFHQTHKNAKSNTFNMLVRKLQEKGFRKLKRSLRQIQTVGGYSNHNIVNRLLHNLEKIGKIEIRKNVKKISMEDYGNRIYKSVFFKNGSLYARLSNSFKLFFDGGSIDFLKEEEEEKLILSEQKKELKQIVKSKRPVYTPPIELLEKFYSFIETKKEKLISYGIIGTQYRKRKVTVAMIPNILKKCLFNQDLKFCLNQFVNIQTEIVKYQKVVSCLYNDLANFEFMTSQWSMYGKKHIAAYRLAYSNESDNIYAQMERFNRDEYLKNVEGVSDSGNGTNDIVLTTYDWSKVYEGNNNTHQSI